MILFMTASFCVIFNCQFLWLHYDLMQAQNNYKIVQDHPAK